MTRKSKSSPYFQLIIKLSNLASNTYSSFTKSQSSYYTIEQENDEGCSGVVVGILDSIHNPETWVRFRCPQPIFRDSFFPILHTGQRYTRSRMTSPWQSLTTPRQSSSTHVTMRHILHVPSVTRDGEICSWLQKTTPHAQRSSQLAQMPYLNMGCTTSKISKKKIKIMMIMMIIKTTTTTVMLIMLTIMMLLISCMPDTRIVS